jgi:hypothetical protein
MFNKKNQSNQITTCPARNFRVIRAFGSRVARPQMEV